MGCAIKRQDSVRLREIFRWMDDFDKAYRERVSMVALLPCFIIHPGLLQA
jgi:hypothetical protein